MSYNNNLNPTSGYWNLYMNDVSNKKPSYNIPFSDLSYCKTTYLEPIIKNKQDIDSSFNNLNTKITSFNSKFSNYNGTADFCNTVSDAGSIVDCKNRLIDINANMNDINDGILKQNSRFDNLKSDNKCNSIDYNTLQSQYQAMIKKRQEIDYVVNQYNKKNNNSLVHTNLQETDVFIYTGILWIVLGTSALYFSFRYINE